MRISSACEIFDASAPGSAPSTHPSAWKKHSRKYAVAISGPRHLQTANTAGVWRPGSPPRRMSPRTRRESLASACDFISPDFSRIRGVTPLRGLGPIGPGLWTLTPGKNRCPKLLTPERLATPTAARELSCVSLASLVILEEQSSVFPADPPELPPDRCPLPTRTTQRRHKPEPPAHLCTLGDKNIRAGEAAPARSSDRQPVRQAPVVPQRRCLGLVVYLCVHRSLPPTASY
jgi:hypothetical protein